ncbi:MULTISPECIES: toxin C-terminal domain-containing protein [unclassified Pseudomonas]|uniref:toxin C-terminal domain-containing protein n=1 Tax=unclassified Pseudomonas TaxID=196821 RepID=UPI0030DB4DB3
MTAAAREGDSIEHSSALAGLLIGLAVGAAATALIVGTGGLAAVTMIGAGAAAGAGIGQLIGSLSFCRNEAGKITSGSPNVFFNGKPAARAHLDHVDCDQHGIGKVLAEGSTSVYINGQPAARVDDRTECDGKISTGSGNIFIGGGTQLTDAINPEVPVWLQWTIGGIGFASAVVLTGGFLIPIVAFFGGVAGGIGGHWFGGKLFGDGSNGQKLTAFGGAFLGGMLGAKGGSWFDKRYTIKTEGFGSNLANLRVVPKHAEIAKKLDYIKINERSHGQAVYYNSKAPSELRYITRDIDQHNGGFWKAANSVKNLGNKTIRSGTYNEYLTKVGK